MLPILLLFFFSLDEDLLEVADTRVDLFLLHLDCLLDADFLSLFADWRGRLGTDDFGAWQGRVEDPIFGANCGSSRLVKIIKTAIILIRLELLLVVFGQLADLFCSLQSLSTLIVKSFEQSRVRTW